MAKPQVAKEPGMTEFEKDLLESIRQAKRGEGRVTKVAVTAATEARMKLGVSQSAFAKLLGVSVRTLQEWEQGRREPSGAARTLLRIALHSPEAILQAGRVSTEHGILIDLPPTHSQMTHIYRRRYIQWWRSWTRPY